MGTKSNPAAYDCYANALPDEPMFVLLARDPTAPGLVSEWAQMRQTSIVLGERPASDVAMVQEAMVCAENMVRWREANDGIWRTAKVPTAAAPDAAGANAALVEALRLFLERVENSGDWDDGCFYFAGRAAPELQEPIKRARAALAKAQP